MLDNSECHLNPDESKTERFLRLLTTNNKRIYAYIFTLLPNYFDADDIMQETVTYMYRHFDDFEPETNFVSWALRIAHYRVLTFVRKNKNKRLQFDNNLLKLLDAEMQDTAENVSGKMDALKHCRSKLCEQDGRLLHLRYEQGYSTKQIAETLGRSIFHVYRALARIHESLLHCIRRRITEM